MQNQTIQISVSVIPRSSKSKIVCDENGELKLYLNSPPVDGKANSECIKLLSEKLSIAKSKIKLHKGEKSRKKIFLIEGYTFEKLFECLNNKIYE